MRSIKKFLKQPLWLALLAVPALLTLGAAFEAPREFVRDLEAFLSR